MALPLKGSPIHFGPFLVTSQVVFHLTPLSFALVNLKPILPGHVLVSPRRIVARLADLTPSETADLFLTVRRVGRMIERVYGATSLNVAVQDGVDAGQSVPHVHAHIIPRRRADLPRTDAVYDALDGREGDVMRNFRGALRVDELGRKAREMREMEEEACRLAGEMEGEPLD
ncbi:hypothetical protein P175DRAFT_0482776 [Aspergillus ochraceoroseus IBT 24754]|uniref:Bis(5'-adenosyl)-triphosphatase n=3 Tax=Aspergillus subgen. Nidulantes TaxID=2720870 RepID=A0A0F8V7Z0_9EURO|nr:uncharacterized protein P175DRAFT_0482776 [Aspergillus ochraceoroseus IBT 24754]KKK19101.1 bis(5'-nucleosyl)-tetraphosphatase (asymmetrical) [Aspergillus rambellii]PTU19425.1 hypothetical protein P175DRAFT_0482776 [Aspergillus ochraceoroseus IBT 24754]